MEILQAIYQQVSTITGFPRTSVLGSCHSGLVSVVVRVHTRLPGVWETQLRKSCALLHQLIAGFLLQDALQMIFLKKQYFSSQNTFGQPDASLCFQLSK